MAIQRAHCIAVCKLWGPGVPGASCIAVYYLTPFWVILSWSHICFVVLTSLDKKAVKELYERRIGDEDVYFYIFPLFPGFNNHSMGEGIFPEYN